ncbi:MAG: DNA methyltransferase [Thermoplasmata archaeon]
MISAYVELSGEAVDLARAEAVSAVEALDGRSLAPDIEPLVRVEVVDEGRLLRLAERLALARRCLIRVGEGIDLEASIAAEATAGESAAFRRLGRSPGGSDRSVLAAGRSYRASGGTIDLDHPVRRYWIASDAEGREILLREIAAVDRRGPSSRRMPLLPFQRPVSLPPRLARAAANLARVRPGDRVVDPFLGTGALLAEAALLGAHVYGIDRDPEMVRGSIRNFAHLGAVPSRLTEGDAGEVELGAPDETFDALLTDPPYGRSSWTGGESSSDVVARVLPRWAGRVREGGRLVVVAPSGAPTVGPPWTIVGRAAVRVHRSLTREFRVYERAV